jgi:hypothetical protein
LIGVPLLTWVPATGLWEAMFPVATLCEQAEVWVPTVRLLLVMELPALVWENPTTLGTPMVD